MPDVNGSVTESMVTIDGKQRPLKDYEAEIRRKHDEEVQRVKDEYEARMVAIQTRQPERQPENSGAFDWLNQYTQAAENEIATTGRSVPIQTIAHLAGQIAQRGIQETLSSREKAESVKRQFAKNARKNQSEWNDIEEDFHEIADQLPANQVNQQTLEVILNAARGKRTPDLIKAAQEKFKKDAEGQPEILGNPTESSRAGASGTSLLTAAQRDELSSLDREGSLGLDEDWYLKNLKTKQEQAKARGEIVPMLLHEKR